MHINAANFINDFNMPLQQTDKHFEHSKPKTSVALPADIKPEQKAEVEDLGKLKSALAEHNITLKFSRDDKTNAIIVELVNEKTGEAIRQIPSEVSLKLAAEYVKTQGQFIDEIK